MVMDRKPWLAHYPPQIPAHLEYPDIPLTDLLKEAQESFPHHPAIRYLGKTISYQQLYLDVQRFAGVLKKMGVEKGDRVAIMLPNCPQAVICYYGILQIGAVVVQTNPLYTERELLHQLNDAGAEIMVCLDLVYRKVKSIREKSKLRDVIVTGIEDYLPFPKNYLFPIIQRFKGAALRVDDDENRYWRLKTLLKETRPFQTFESIEPEKDLALLQYTGGTTGVAKGVMLTHRNLVANVIQCRRWFYRADQGEERFLAVVPFFHVYGMTVGMNLSICLAGCLIVIPKFDIPLILKTIGKEKPTVFPGAPTMYIGLLNHELLTKYNISSIDACLSGSAALPLEVQEKFEEITGGRLVEGYGLTECSPVTHANLIWNKRKTGSIGLPWPDTDAKIISLEDGTSLLPGEIGELAIKGPQVMKGYWNQPLETEQVFQDGWLLTGDLGYMDEEGFFYIVDRKKDMIIAGGFNIYPREVEEVLFEHPDVLEAAVVGVPDPYRGETVKAFIVFKEGKKSSEEELDQFCRERLAAYKVPRQYEFRQELPKTMVGKVLRRSLKE